MRSNLTIPERLPDWIPEAVKIYLDHTERGVSLREIARREGTHASTVMRQVRRYETRRDDPLMDEALTRLSHDPVPNSPDGHGALTSGKDQSPMSMSIRPQALTLDEATLQREARRILRRLAEPGAVLVIAPDLEKAVVTRELADGKAARLAVLDRSVAQAFVLKDWIQCRKAGRVSTYELTAPGRAALKRMMEEEGAVAGGFAEAAMPFADQHRVWAEREVAEPEGPRRMRFNLAESPIAALGRRLDKKGKPFLSAELVSAAERLREDFELAQMGPRVAQNWERFLTGNDRGGFKNDSGLAEGPRAARERVACALRELGGGLGDVTLRVCCYLEGIEAFEKRSDWPARSGKLVLRIALQRLRRHYEETYGKSGPLIG